MTESNTNAAHETSSVTMTIREVRTLLSAEAAVKKYVVHVG
jgi:hypothetical protein